MFDSDAVQGMLVQLFCLLGRTNGKDATQLPQGVEWIDEHRLMFASDRAKAKQPFICTTRDQGVHVSRIPELAVRPSMNIKMTKQRPSCLHACHF